MCEGGGFTAFSQVGHVLVTEFADQSANLGIAVEAATHEILREGGLEIRPAEFLALADGRPIALTVRELALLAALARRSGRIVSREELYAVVWNRPFRKHERSVDVYVRKLRNKLEEAIPGERFIHTHFGFGYRFHRELSQHFHTTATPR
jgi:DNA-binding response OmpR family regulator